MIYTYEIKAYSFSDRKLGSGKYRYTGRYADISYTIDSENQMTQDELFDKLSNIRIDYLLDMEGYIISM